MPVTIRDKKTGEVTQREVVDAREILANLSDRYEQVVEKDGSGPQIMNMQDEFERNPVGANVPKKLTDEDEVVRIRNPVSDQPRMAMPPGVSRTNPDAEGAGSSREVDRDMLESMTVPDLKDKAAAESIDLGDATLKADIVNKMLRESRKRVREAEAAGKPA